MIAGQVGIAREISKAPVELNGDDKARGVFGGLSAGLLLALMAVLAGGAALRESVTIDEVAHIGAGVSYLQKLDLRMNDEHPPLPKVLAALPLVLRGVRTDYGHISWTVSDKFIPAFAGEWVFGEWLLEKWNEPKSVLAWARFPMLLMMLALGWVVYACGRRLGGTWGGLLCLTVYVSTPMFLAFGPLVHTDIAVTLFSVLALWMFAAVWKEPNRKNVFLFALSLAAALLSKFTAGILFFAFGASVLSLRWRAVSGQPQDKAEARAWRRVRRRATFKGVLWAALTVYVFYFIFSWHQPTTSVEEIGTGPMALVLRRLLWPAVLYLRGAGWVLLTGIRPTFILGHSYTHGVWFYFPVVFTLKSSLGFLALLTLCLAVAVTRRFRRGKNVAAIPEQQGMRWRVFWVSLLVFTAACMVSPLNISIRHFSVPVVLLILLLAPLPRMFGELRDRTRFAAATGTALLAASCLFTAVRAYPYYFPYINALSFGRPAFTLINDSNVDWNQSLPEVKRLAEQHGLATIRLDEYGLTDPTVWVPPAQLWDCQRPAPEDGGQWVVLSANMILDGHNCGWLLQYPREALAGGSLYALRLPARIPPAGIAGGPPLPSSFRQLGGAFYDVRTFTRHLFEYPDDLPRALDWMQSLFESWRKTHQPPAGPIKFPWEP
jgi:4-amino-4-deoxy-L-arabinose transferase-like glycosyltransferase